MSGETPFFKSAIFAELKENLRTYSRFTATYQIMSDTYEEARDIAHEISIEQTVECPYELIEGSEIADTIVGQVEELKEGAPHSGCYYATISYDPEAVNGEMTELINMLFGNTSLKKGIKLMSIDLPENMYNDFPGPKFGRQGIRELCGVLHGPILMSAVKPLGRSTKELAHMVYQLAIGGCPIIKDDHSLCDQRWSPFEERVRACVDAVEEANAETGGHSIYVPNCTADGLEFLERAYKAQDLGAKGIMAAPALTGFSLIHDLSRDSEFQLPIFLHPSFTGPYITSPNGGVSPYCYYGQLYRLAGGDAAIFTSFGGRFPFSIQTCQKICEGTDAPMADLRPSFPVPSGGMKWQLFPKMYDIYGPDTIFLVGGALQTEGPDLTENTRFFMQKLHEAAR